MRVSNKLPEKLTLRKRSRNYEDIKGSAQMKLVNQLYVGIVKISCIVPMLKLGFMDL